MNSEALHGEKVGVGTLLAVKEYHRLGQLQTVNFKDYEAYSEQFVYEMFGDSLTEEILGENKKDAAEGITGEQMAKCWKAIRKEIEAIPSVDFLTELYQRLGIKSKLSDIQVADEKEYVLLQYSPCVRNRLTLMRLKKTFS